MKNLIFILLAFILIACNKNLKKKDTIIGTWEVVSIIDIETGEVELQESDNLAFVEVKSDTIYLSSDKAFAWRIEGDSIFLDEFGSVYIKELSKNRIIVEYNFLGKTRLILKKKVVNKN
jgi:hypothetical protein